MLWNHNKENNTIKLFWDTQIGTEIIWKLFFTEQQNYDSDNAKTTKKLSDQLSINIYDTVSDNNYIIKKTIIKVG